MIPFLFNLIKNSPKILWCLLFHNDRNHWDVCQKCGVELKEIIGLILFILIIFAIIIMLRLSG